MEKKYILAVDLGGTGTRTLVFDRNLKLVAQDYSQLEAIHSGPDEVDIDPEKMWDKIVGTMRGAVEKAGIDPAEIEAVGCSYMRGTMILWDKTTGKSICDGIIWYDNRSYKGCRKMLNIPGFKEDCPRQAALMAGGWHNAATMYEKYDVYPDIKARINEDPNVVWGTCDAWLCFKMTGNHLTDYSTASSFHSLETYREHDLKLLQYVGMRPEMMPKYVPDIYDFGMLNKEILGVEIPVRAFISDQQSALFAQGCHVKGTAKCTLGTGAFADINVGEEYMPAPAQGLNPMIAWDLGEYGGTSWLLEGGTHASGQNLQWAKDSMELVENFRQLDELAASVEDSNGLVYVPGIMGLGEPPFHNPTARASFMGISTTTKKAHFCRALVEALGFQAVSLFETLPKMEMKRICLDGGASKGDITCQVVADLTGATVIRPKLAEATAMGAAEMAAIGSGWYTLDETRDLLAGFGADIFEPCKDEEKLAKLRKTYQLWYKACQRSFDWIE